MLTSIRSTGVSQLSVRDFELVLEVVAEVTATDSRDEFFQTALAGIARAIPSLVVTANEVDPGGESVIYWAEPPAFPIPQGAPELLAEFALEHPIISYMSKTGDGSAHRISDFWSRREYSDSRLYRDLYSPMGVEYQIAVSLPARRPIVLGIAVCRSEGEDFSERDRLVLNTLRPHLAHAWRNARDRDYLRSLLDAASGALQEQGLGFLVLSCPLEEVTSGTLASIRRFFGESAASELPPRVVRWLEGQARTHDAPQDLTLKRPLSAAVEGERLILRYLPSERTHPGAIVARVERESEERHSLEAFGLTRREAEVVRLVTRGSTNIEIARELSIAAATVKKHLENIYMKLGVSGRGPLTALVLNLSGR